MSAKKRTEAAPSEAIHLEPGEAEHGERVLELASLPSAASAAAPGLSTARVTEILGDGARVVVGGQTIEARSEIHVEVLRTALRTGERVLVERDAAGAWTVIGALRTAPVPGVDRAEAFTIEADRVDVVAKEKAQIVSGAAAIVLRAEEGEVETTAPRIVSRAEGLHKIAGRMLRLN